MNKEERFEFYKKESEQYAKTLEAQESPLEFQFPYKLDMPRWKFATKHFINKDLIRLDETPANQLPRLKILDIGCQNGPFALGWIAMGYDVTAIDISHKYAGLARKYIKKFACHDSWRVVQADVLTDIGKIMNHGPFDCVAALEVVEHLPDLNQFLNAVAQVTKHDAIMAINVPNGNSWASDKGHLKSFWCEEAAVVPEGDQRTPHEFPDCFDRAGWLVDVDHRGCTVEAHRCNEERGWLACLLNRDEHSR